MAYSMIVWLVNPGVHPQQEEEEVRISDGLESAPGAHTGANIGYALPRMTYGVYETEDEAGKALEDITAKLKQNEPLTIDARSHRQFLIPADRVHYVVCEEVTRPKDG